MDLVAVCSLSFVIFGDAAQGRLVRYGPSKQLQVRKGGKGKARRAKGKEQRTFALPPWRFALCALPLPPFLTCNLAHLDSVNRTLSVRENIPCERHAK
jgi:hypothetical protein